MVKGRDYKGLSTDATPALARRFKAMSIMAFDVNGRLPNWHWGTDTSDNVARENIEHAVELAAGMIRDSSSGRPARHSPVLGWHAGTRVASRRDCSCVERHRRAQRS